MSVQDNEGLPLAQPHIGTPSPIKVQSNGSMLAHSPINTPFNGDSMCNEIDRSSNLFSQLDAMIAAVQSESTAIDSMRDKVKEIDTMKEYISQLSKKLNESSHINNMLKQTLVKSQEQVGEFKKYKIEVCALNFILILTLVFANLYVAILFRLIHCCPVCAMN